MKATFFITYVMVDGWSTVALEITRIRAFVLFHLKNWFLVKTEKDREEAMDPGSICFYWSEPRIQLYFLLGLVYSTVTPLLLPFILVFFAFAYVVYRHQVTINALFFYLLGYHHQILQTPLNEGCTIRKKWLPKITDATMLAQC